MFSSAAFSHSTLNPWVFALFRDSFGGSTLLLVAFISSRRNRTIQFLPQREDWAHFIVTGLLGIWGAQGLSAVAVSLTTSDYMSLIQPAQTVVAFTASALLGMEPFSLRAWTSYGKVGAVTCTVGGAIFMVLMSSFSGSSVRANSKDLPLGTAYLMLQVCNVFVHDDSN